MARGSDGSVTIGWANLALEVGVVNNVRVFDL